MLDSSDIEIVIFTYKYEHWLPACLDAVASQSLRPARIRVSDDASPGQHGEAFRALAARYPWAEFIQNPANMGTVAHIRQRTSEIKAPYYLLLSADDYLADPDFLRDAVRLLKTHPATVAVYGQYHVIDSAGRMVRAAARLEDGETTEFNALEMRDMLALTNVVPAVCTVVRSAIHQEVPPFPIDNPYTHDWCQWYVMALHGGFIRINRPVMHYRVHQRSVSQSAAVENRSVRETDLTFEQLMAWPGLSAHDLMMLRRGRARNAVRLARMRELPRVLLSQPLRDLSWLDLRENALFRLENVLHRWHHEARKHLRGH